MFNLARFLISGKTIFISPVDWGLGHATRCSAIIAKLSGPNKIIIGVTKLNDFYFNERFPDLEKLYLPSYNVTYSTWLPAWLKVLFLWPRISAVIARERKVLEEILTQRHIDVVISDNRFGLHNGDVKNIFLTHQLQLMAGAFSTIADKLNHGYINAFDEVWVPDYKEIEKRLSGKLSDSAGIRPPLMYIGPQSVLLNSGSSHQKKYDYLIILSGVEPQRTVLEKMLLEKFSGSSLKVFMIRGSRSKLKSETSVPVIDFANASELSQLISVSRTIISRSGYSTLMDLHAAGHTDLILIPTPGQPEQIYLAEHWRKKFQATVVRQHRLKNFDFERK